MSRNLFLALAGLTLLSACGVAGGLDRPAPMWNKEAAQAADARRTAEACQRQIQNNAQRRHCAETAAPSTRTITETTITPNQLPSQNSPPSSPTAPSGN